MDSGLGQASAGNFDYSNDSDFFRFTAEAGQVYQIDLERGTLEHYSSRMRLLDANGHWLSIREHGDSITWIAPESGNYYVEVNN